MFPYDESKEQELRGLFNHVTEKRNVKAFNLQAEKNYKTSTYLSCG